MCGHPEAMGGGGGGERARAWAGRKRLASKEYPCTPESSDALLYPGSRAMLLHRLYPRCSFLITL
jgi:hypothetical protein